MIYFGLAIEGQNTVLPESPLYRPEYRAAWADLRHRRGQPAARPDRPASAAATGMRLLPDGRPLEIVVEDSGESSEKSDVLELVRNSWRQVGIRLFSRPMQLTLFRRRVFAGETLMSLDKGIENGLATAAMSPWEFAPTTPAAAGMAEMGPVCRNQGPGRRGARPAGGGPAQGTLRGLARRAGRRRARADLARDAARSGPTRCIRSASSPASSSRSSSTRGCATCRDGGNVQLGSRRPFRHLQAGRLLVRSKPAPAARRRSPPRRRDARTPICARFGPR